ELRRSLDGFHRFFERYQRLTGTAFYALEAPTKRSEWDLNGSHPEFLAEVGRLRATFLEHLDDDFNTGGAVGVLYELLSTLNRCADAKLPEGGTPEPTALADFRRGVVALKEVAQILGLFHEPPAKKDGGDDELVSGLVQLLIDLRAEARKAKNFALGDQIRDRLEKLHIKLEDRKGGTGWRRE